MKPNGDDLSRLSLLSQSYKDKRNGGRLRKELLKNKRLPKLVSECCMNLRRGTFKVNKDLKKHHTKIVKLSNKGTPMKVRKGIVQTGGFLQFLLPAAITAIASLINMR